MKTLYRHHERHGNRVVSGVFGGLGEWMEVSPRILRVGYIILALITGILPALLLYFAFHFVIPKHRG